MSKETLEYHWGKHHRGYVNNLNKQIEGTELHEKSLESIILASYNKGDILPAFNNAAQVWNHEFFWESMKPGGGGKPSGELLELIIRDFGSFEALIQEFKLAAATHFGSGWTWLVCECCVCSTKIHEQPNCNNIDPLIFKSLCLCVDDIEHKKLAVLKTSNAINPLVLDYYVSKQ
ncbi:putative superoxide dismutase [Helianthus annuus]|nr:putative superoxide dismutase [Helianthus annuus]